MTRPPWTPPPRIRPIAVALIRNAGRLLVMEGRSARGERPYYRPLGGGIEFGERGETAVRRELREEIGLELADVRYLGALENLYEIDGHAGHEIVLVYAAELAADTNVRDSYDVIDEGEAAWRAVWKPINELVAGRASLVPEGLATYLASTDS